MSFTGNIKNEIINIYDTIESQMAELSAIINIEAEISKKEIKISTENIGVSRRLYKLFKDLYRINVDTEKQELNRLGKKYLIEIKVKEKIDTILKDLSIINEYGKRLYEPLTYLIDTEEEKRAYLKGAFLICGSINDPKTARYHAEFIIKKEKSAKFISKLLDELGFNNKILKREKHYMVYMKESEIISDFIKLLNAHNSLFYYEDIRIYRDHKNMTNRLNNCEQANVEKIINSSYIQLENIKILKEKFDFELLDEKIRQICIYKEKYPESSMQELSEIISSETGEYITKSGINHRFRKINQMIKNKCK